MGENSHNLVTLVETLIFLRIEVPSVYSIYIGLCTTADFEIIFSFRNSVFGFIFNFTYIHAC
jgi:hypothetical protein